MKNREINFGGLTDWELKTAMELLIRPEWLMERGCMVAVLKAFDYNAADCREVLNSMVPLHDGTHLCLNTLWQFCRGDESKDVMAG